MTDPKTTIGNSSLAAIAAHVRDFYERHPYPAQAEDLSGYRTRALDDHERRTEHHLFWPFKPYCEPSSILIAGCGTVQAAKHAMRWPRARVVGIDVSDASIAMTQQLKQKYGLANLKLKCLPVEQARALGERFDKIICTGVLHHLPDPDSGLKALREVLAKGGAMHLMLYAPYGRMGVYLLQNYCRLLGIGATSAEIDDLKRTLSMLPRGHSLWPLLQSSPDFSYGAGLADALLHPRDRPYSVGEMMHYVERNGLRFGRWLRQAPYLPHCGAVRNTPHYARLAGLPLEEQYAAMELFRGTMVRHSAIIHRDDEPAKAPAIRFDGEEWPDYRPIRFPEAVCVEDRLPAGVSGVLINRRHTDTDLLLPVTAEEKRLVAAIDGRRTIRELLGDSDISSARSFFERLWQHDQIVFDASAIRSIKRRRHRSLQLRARCR
jgi:SAM-dependent methyltransferase